MKKIAVLTLALLLMAVGAFGAAWAEEELTLSSAALEMFVGKSATLKATPSRGVSWQSTDASVAAVNQSGQVTAKKAGECRIVATLGSQKAECQVTVRKAATGVTLDKKSMTLDVGQTGQVTATVTPADAAYPPVEYTSSNPQVATVDQNGVVTAVKKGQTQIRATAAGGKYAAITVTVRIPPSGITLNKTELTVFKGATSTLKATVSPNNAYSKNVKWTSSDTRIAAVNAYGTVTGRGLGECVITCTAANGLTAQCHVTVKIAVSSVKITSKGRAVDVGGEPLQLTVQVSPANASDKSLTFRSDKPEVASVDQNGLVTGHKKGTATITVTSVSGKRSTYAMITVRVPPASITLKDDEITAFKGSGSVTLKATVLPKEAYSKTVKWTSSDTRIATVNQYGAVTGKGAGECVITGTTVNGLTVTAKVTVKVPVTSVKVTADKKQIDVGSAGASLTAAVSPADASDKTVTWKSSNPAVATVDENGHVTPLKKGTVTISATSVSNKKVGQVNITVRIPPQSVTLDKTDLIVFKGQGAKTVKATVLPKDAYSRSVTWKSSDTKIATVNQYGAVTAKGNGSCVITATTANGLTATLNVTSQVPVTSVKVTADKKQIDLGSEGANVTASVGPSDATDKSITWKSSKPDVASVDQSGHVTPVAKGSAVITATALSGKSGSVTVTVRVPPSGVTLSQSSLTLNKGGKTVTLKATVSPSDAYSKTVTWKSSDTKVATVNTYGTVTAKGAGECDITATAAGGKVLDTCHVKVIVAVTGVTMDKKSLTLVYGGKSGQLTASVTPADASDKSVTWKSANPGVASVDGTGAVTPVSVGSTKVTASSANGKSVTVNVTVVQPATSLTLDASSKSLQCGGTATLKANVGPASAGDKSVTWTSSDKNVAAVGSDGKVYAKSEGTCTITAKANGSVAELTASCQVTVTGKPNKYVAITFDGGPTKAATASILSTLDTYGVKATFFMLGGNAAKYPDLVRRVVAAGHEIGNHSYTHPRLTELPMNKVREEIEKTDEAVYKAAGVYPTVIRPPYGAINRKIAETETRAFVNWNVVSHDATYDSAARVISITLSSVGNHGVILCHDTVTWTAEAVKTIIPTLLSRGYTFVTVSQMMEICGYKPGDSVAFAPALVK